MESICFGPHDDRVSPTYLLSPEQAALELLTLFAASMLIHVGCTLVIKHLTLPDGASTSWKSSIGYATLVVNTHTTAAGSLWSAPCFVVFCAMAFLSSPLWLQDCTLCVGSKGRLFSLSCKQYTHLARIHTRKFFSCVWLKFLQARIAVFVVCILSGRFIISRACHVSHAD